MPPSIRQSSPDQANEKKCLCLRPSSLLAAGFLVAAAVVLAYLGGVMSGRAYWKAHAPQIAARMSPAGAAEGEGDAPGEAAGEAGAGEQQKVLAPEELRFARVLRNDVATGDAPLKPLPPMKPMKPAQPLPSGVTQATAPGAQAQPPAQGQAQQGQAAPVAAPQPSGMYDYVFQVGAFKDADAVDSLRQRLEGRGLRTRMERSGKLYVVLVLLRGTEARAAEVQHTTTSMGLGKPIQRSRKAVRQ